MTTKQHEDTHLTSPDASRHWFADARFGLFIHYGLYSLLGRGEWVMNREQIQPHEYKRLAGEFRADQFNPEAICDLAVEVGMKYVVFTTMHHEGFRLYPTELSDFNVTRSPCGRDLVAEVINAARARGLRVGLYHSLNNWTDSPDAVEALESRDAYERFIEGTFARIRELVSRYNPIDILWYDGWWPFNAQGWRAEEMNAMVRAIQPHILFNGRNGLPGDFATPEGHMRAPLPWRPWEACMTHNNSWGYHAGDQDWKSVGQVIDLLSAAASGRGNLLFNVGPRGDGSLPEQSVSLLRAIGQWQRSCGESMRDTELFTYDLQTRGEHRGDWSSHGTFTVRGNTLYLLARRWPGDSLTLAGLEVCVLQVELLTTGRAPQDCSYTQKDGKLTVHGLSGLSPDSICPVFKFTCDRPPVIYLTGGLRTPVVPHPHYDPCPSDIAH
jgi:alpha-L-fucosidase